MTMLVRCLFIILQYLQLIIKSSSHDFYAVRLQPSIVPSIHFLLLFRRNAADIQVD